MQVTETLNEGLKRQLSMVIPATDLVSRLDDKLNEMSATANIKGFRPGKVPVSHLKKVYGRSAMSEVMQDAINTSIQDTLSDREEKAAAQPEIDLSEDQAVINSVLDGDADLEVSVSYEVLPAIELADFSKVKIEKPVVPVTDEAIQTELDRLFADRREYEESSKKAKDGDRVTMKFEGRIDGELFEGGATESATLVLGSGQYIPGFEEQLVGQKKGDKLDVKVTFPEDYASAELAGKDAEFATEILNVESPKADGELNDDFAKSLGMDDVAALRDAISKQIEANHAILTNQRVKRLVLDALDEGHKIDLPEKLVSAEFDTIWGRVMHEIEHHGKTFESEGTTEEEARAQYQAIAERRVRLGLVVAEIGNKNEIEVTQEEHQQALMAEVQRFPGQEQQVYDFYRNNAQALAGLRAPVFENKVVDFVVELADVSEKEVTREELTKLVEASEEEGPISSSHDHDHGHDH